MANIKASRKRTPPKVETAILIKSARRCPLCFYLHGDLKEKPGQIAHLDQDPSNYAEDNLAFLCMVHHSLYDSKTKQHKNYTVREVKAARSKLYELVGKGTHLTSTIGAGSGQPARVFGPKVVVTCDGAPRTSFWFTNDGDARAFTVRVDPVPPRGGFPLVFPDFAELAPDCKIPIRPIITPTPFNIVPGSPDKHFMWAFWKSVNGDASLPFLVHYIDMDSNRYITEYVLDWAAASHTTQLWFKRWATE